MELVGVAAPYCPQIPRGAFTAMLRHSTRAPVLVDHDWRDRVAEASLWQSAAGLCCRFVLAPCCVRRLIERGQVRGLSIRASGGFDAILEVSIMWRHCRPRLPGTWLLPAAEAERRLRRGDLEVCA